MLVASILAVALFLRMDGAGAQTDDHADYITGATHLPLGSSIAGRIDSGDDIDVFRLDISGSSATTDVWVYTTGDTDTFGRIYDDAVTLIVGNHDSYIIGRWYNFHVRADLTDGIYYIAVYGRDGSVTGDYVLHTEAVTDTGVTIPSATRLELDRPVAGRIDSVSETDYFRVDIAERSNLYIYAVSVNGDPILGYTVDSADDYIPTNQYLYPSAFSIRDSFDWGTQYIKVVTPEDALSGPVPYTVHVLVDSPYNTFIEDCEAATQAMTDTHVEDSLYGCQWHLQSQAGENINVEPVWADGIRGENVSVALVDVGFDLKHEDLSANVDASRNHDYTGYNNIYRPYLHHGTHMAGIIAARDNQVGLRGVAPRATIYGYNPLVDFTDLNIADAITRHAVSTAVSNNSWGIGAIRDPAGLTIAPQIWELSVDTGLTTGYGGKGTFYSVSGGNGHLEGGHANLEETYTYHGVTVACATNNLGTRAAYSELGSNLWVCAPSGGFDGNLRITTTENHDRYYRSVGGTSAATAVVSGVAALMRDANPDLTWRDLKLILAASVRKPDPGNPGWLTGAAKYGADTDLYHFNHEYGFGVVDAQAAVNLAKDWQNLPPMLTSSVGSALLNAQVPDAPVEGPTTTVTYALNLDSDIDFTEFVEVNVEFNHQSFRDLKTELVSPAGAVSDLVVPHDTYTPDDPDDIDFFPLIGSFRLGSARHLGEDPNGIWTLRITDHFAGPLGTRIFKSWGLTVYGHAQSPVEPQVEVNFAQSAYSVTEGDTVDVIVTLSADPQRTVTIPIAVTNQGGATAVDYLGVLESVPFVSGGPTQQTIIILAIDDQVADANESVKLGFGVLPAGVSAGATAKTIVSITDNDAPRTPTVQMSLAETPTVRLGTSIPVTVRFDQSVSGFGIDDVAVTNGRPENLTGESGGTDYSFDVVPTAIGVVNVDIAAGAAQNQHGENSLASLQLHVGLPYDDDHNGIINREEVITAIGDYLFGGSLSRDEVIAIIGLYLFG